MHARYLNLILEELARTNPRVTTALGTNMHWGYWRDPARADTSLEGFAAAADDLTRALVAPANVRNGTRVLDAGCGFGGAIRLLDATYEDLRIEGLNIDARQIARARQLVHGSTVRRNTVGFVVADACHLPYASQSFDTLLAVECVFHFPSLTKFFEEAARVLKPGGRLVLSDFLSREDRPVNPLSFLWSGGWSLHRMFGPGPPPRTWTSYGALAEHSGFNLTETIDITESTMPTYTVLKSLGMEFGSAARTFVTATECLRKFSERGLCSYGILAFQKR